MQLARTAAAPRSERKKDSYKQFARLAFIFQACAGVKRNLIIAITLLRVVKRVPRPRVGARTSQTTSRSERTGDKNGAEHTVLAQGK